MCDADDGLYAHVMSFPRVHRGDRTWNPFRKKEDQMKRGKARASSRFSEAEAQRDIDLRYRIARI